MLQQLPSPLVTSQHSHNSRPVLGFSALAAYFKNRDTRTSPLNSVWSGAQALKMYNVLWETPTFIGVQLGQSQRALCLEGGLVLGI